MWGLVCYDGGLSVGAALDHGLVGCMEEGIHRDEGSGFVGFRYGWCCSVRV